MYGRTLMPTTSMGMPTQYHWQGYAPHDAVPCPHCSGTGFWSDAWNWTKNAANSVANFVKPIVKPIASTAANFIVVNAGLSALGLGRPRRISQRQRERSEICKAIMRERGVNLPTASAIVKREGLF
jgi:hypothetical protein